MGQFHAGVDKYGVHPVMLQRWKKQALDDFARLFVGEEQWETSKAHYEKRIEELYAEVGRLTTQLSWLKKKASALTRDERLALLDREVRELPLTTQAELLGLNRSSLYYQPAPPSPEEVALKHRIDEIYTDHPFYGSRRITAQLQREGWLVNRKAIQRHMREMGLEGIAPKRNRLRHHGEGPADRHNSL